MFSFFNSSIYKNITIIEDCIYNGHAIMDPDNIPKVPRGLILLVIPCFFPFLPSMFPVMRRKSTWIITNVYFYIIK